MDKEIVVKFFDSLAENWDKGLITDREKINYILDRADINAGDTVLDVACGTGVLFPFYLERGVKKIIGVDFSRNMLDIAKEKFKNDNIEFICSDVENLSLNERASKAVVFNAFPHFINPEKIIENVAKNLCENGRLTVAHDMGRAALDRHHSGAAKNVSNGLGPAKETARIMEKYFLVDTVCDEEDIYIVSGTKI